MRGRPAAAETLLLVATVPVVLALLALAGALYGPGWVLVAAGRRVARFGLAVCDYAVSA